MPSYIIGHQMHSTCSRGIASVISLLLLLLPPSPASAVESVPSAEPLLLNCTNGDLTTELITGVSQVVLTAEGARRCRLSVSSGGAGRWYITLRVSADSADGDLLVAEDGGGIVSWSGPGELSSQTLSRAMTLSGRFQLDLTLRWGRLDVRASLVGPADCPPETDGWTAAAPGGPGCLLVSLAIGNALGFADSQRACHRVGANLYTTATNNVIPLALEHLFYANVLRRGFGYWIGGRLVDGDWVYINGSRLAEGDLPPYKYECGQSSTICQCVLYRENQFYRSTCTDSRPFVCLAPLGGTLEFYPAEGTPCRDCRDVTGTISSSQDGESPDRFYFYVLGICAVILILVTAAVLACFVDSVKRWKLDAKLAARRPPAYDSQLPLRLMTARPSDLESEPPVYDNFALDVDSPANQEQPGGIAAPTNQDQPDGISAPANQEQPRGIAVPDNRDPTMV